MRLKLKELQKVVEQTVAEEKNLDVLREEISRVLGPSVITDVKLEHLAEGANDRLDVLERTGRMGRLDFKPSVLLKFANNPIAEVRRLVVRITPDHFANQFKNDRDPAVRHAAAKKLPLQLVKEMLRRDPNDDELHQIYHQRKLSEAGLPEPKKQEGHFDLYGEKLGDAVKQDSGPELSDLWYTTAAHKAISDYNRNIEGQWDEPWVHRYCSSLRASSGVEIDERKLWKEIQKQLTDRDDRTLKRYGLKEVARRLIESSEDDFDLYVEELNPVQDLIESDLSSIEYVNKANSVFRIKESIMPPGIKKYRVSEGRRTEFRIPCNGTIPGGKSISRLEEKALDMYVRRWNDVQAQRGEPVRINWTPNPGNASAFSFSAELK